MIVPVSAQRKGTWGWHERTPPTNQTPEQPGPWTTTAQPAVPVDPRATFTIEPPEIRSGVLLFTPHESGTGN